LGLLASESTEEKSAGTASRQPKETHSMSEVVCTSCGYVGEPREITKGSIWIEVVLWLCFIVPGIIYSVWRSSTSAQLNVCPSCGQTALIPVDSRIAQKFLRENLIERKASRPPSKTAQGVGRALGRVVGRLLK
jgi:ribosomal protein L32